MIFAHHLDDLTIEERVSFVRRRLALIFSAIETLDAPSREALDVHGGIQEAAREAHEALQAFSTAPAEIANWSPATAIEPEATTATACRKKGGTR